MASFGAFRGATRIDPPSLTAGSVGPEVALLRTVLSTTRVSKTRLAELLIAQDIRRGDEVVTEVATRVTGQLPSEGESVAFKQFV
jgi:hypothetical protein